MFMDEGAVTSKMQTVLDLVRTDIASVRTGRAVPSMVESIVVPAYGGTQRLKVMELATITASDPQTLVVSPWDKSIIGEIRQGILAANVGFNPSIDGEIIRITLAPMTTEDREKYVKLLSGKIESGRVMIRQIRGEVMQEIKKKFEAKEISEDEKFRLEKKTQELTDNFIGKIEELGETKKKELMGL